jgi:hypothetical protein
MPGTPHEDFPRVNCSDITSDSISTVLGQDFLICTALKKRPADCIPRPYLQLSRNGWTRMEASITPAGIVLPRYFLRLHRRGGKSSVTGPGSDGLETAKFSYPSSTRFTGPKPVSATQLRYVIDQCLPLASCKSGRPSQESLCSNPMRFPTIYVARSICTKQKFKKSAEKHHIPID